jgi:hypothetical protein
MQLAHFDDPAAFYERVRDFLLAHEAANCLPLGLCSALIQDKHWYGEDDPYLCAVIDDDGAVIGLALRTPPHGIVVAHSDRPDIIAPLVADIRARYSTLPTVSGPQAMSRAFAATWTEATGQPHHLGMAQRIYQLEQVNPVTGVPGAARPAIPADRDLLMRWWADFMGEALPEETPDASERIMRRIERGIDQARYWLWVVDEVPVSWVGFQGPTPNGIRLGPVYTPPEQRRRGYASALTATVSQHLLDGGRKYCFLFTDLGNPTSNKIYMDVGYHPVCDVDLFHFADS